MLAFTLLLTSAESADAGSKRARLSSDLTAHLNSTSDASVDFIFTGSVESADRLAKRHGLRIKKFLSSGAVFSASKQQLEALAADGEVESVSGNSLVRSHMAVTTAVTGAQAAWAGAVQSLGPVDGRGIGVAILDSGIAGDHPALANRVIVNVDFTDPKGRGQDFYGHGTHIAGIVAARDFRNPVAGADSGMAPAAHLINLKVLGSDGSGKAADLIEAIDWAIRYRKEFGIRVLNLSLGAAPTQSYKDDPICLAVERAVKAGLVVVASAGNYGQTEDGKLVFGSVTSPGISPYAITVGALAHAGRRLTRATTSGAVELEGSDVGGSHRQARPGRARLEDRVDGGGGLGVVEHAGGSTHRRPRRARLRRDERHEHGGGGGERRGGVVAGWRGEADAAASEAGASGERRLLPTAGLLASGAGTSESRRASITIETADSDMFRRRRT